MEAVAGQVNPALTFTFFGSEAFGQLQLITKVMSGEEHMEQSEMRQLEQWQIM
jgi:hypothetical protein